MSFEPLNEQEDLLFQTLQHPDAPLAMMRAQLEGEDVAVIGVVDQSGEQVSFTPIAMLINTGTKGEEIYHKIVPPEGAEPNFTPEEFEYLDFVASQFDEIDADATTNRHSNN